MNEIYCIEEEEVSGISGIEFVDHGFHRSTLFSTFK